ncbi:DHA1 family bicyclomycin/chloramphenicol resistance-like MFS transporter [Oxalobacteraceae bacterium GrIS 1.11]
MSNKTMPADPSTSRAATATLVLSCALVFLTQLGVTLYLPSLPAIAGALHLTHERAALSLLAYFLGCAAPILFWGAAADHFGRKPVLLFSLAIFGLASLAAAGAGDGDVFIAARLMQGIGAGGGSIIGRILVRDGASGPLLARNLSYLSFAFVSALGGGQFLGGLVEQYANWQMEFYLLAGSSAVLMLAVLATRMRVADKGIRHAHVASYLAVLRNTDFLRPMVAGALGYGALIFLQEIGPAVFQHNLGLTARQYGNIGLLLGLSYFIGSMLVNRLVLRTGNAALMRAGLQLMCGAGCVLLAASLLWHQQQTMMLALLLLIYCAVQLGQAMLFPNSMTTALDAVKGQGSHATALFGFALQLIATGIGSLALVIPHEGYAPVALLLICLTAAALLLGASGAARTVTNP